MSEIKSVCITTQQPRGKNPSAIEIGYYAMDCFVQVCDEVGMLMGKKVALNGDDEYSKMPDHPKSQWRLNGESLCQAPSLNVP
jgi:hypothetical protein